MSEPSSPVLFYERGASWYWVLSGPAAAVAMLLIVKSDGGPLRFVIPLMFLLIVSGFVALQVKAARVHASVELTAETLREGTETIRIDDILLVYPEPEQPARRREKTEKWQEARALGELSGVPRNRVGIGLRLAGGRTVQAWARHHRGLRAALTPLVQERMGTASADDLADILADDEAEEQW